MKSRFQPDNQARSGMVEDIQKPAKLEFRIVNVDSNARLLRLGKNGQMMKEFHMLRCFVVMPNQTKERFG